MLYLKAVRCYNEEKLIRKGKFFMKISDYATGLQHLGIPTKDMAETLLFYSELGFEIAHATKNEATGQAVNFLKLGNLVIEAYESDDAAMCCGGIEHAAVTALKNSGKFIPWQVVTLSTDGRVLER